MSQVRIVPLGPFSLAASSRFLCGFTPASGAARARGDDVSLAFLADVSFTPTAVRLEQREDVVLGRVFGQAGGAAGQVARVLSLDHDARGLADVGARDPVARRLLDEHVGFRPVCFASPYEAAIWGVLAQRTPMRLAANVKRRLAVSTGGTVAVDGALLIASPPPHRLLALTRFDGVSEEKLSRLHAVARAALDGKLLASRLRAMDPADALSELRQIRGVGAWTAEHVLMRGCGPTDTLATQEPRLLAAVARAYGLASLPDSSLLLRIAEKWRPFRMWISVMLVMASMRASGARGRPSEAAGAQA